MRRMPKFGCKYTYNNRFHHNDRCTIDFYYEVFDIILYKIIQKSLLNFNRNYIKTAEENLTHSFKKNRVEKTINESIKEKMDSKFLGVCFKILVNYMQLIGIVTSFDMHWPFYSRSFFTFQSGVGSLSTQFFSLDCFAKGILSIIMNKI